MAMKRTWKAVLAARVLAEKRGSTISHVLQSMSMDELYLTLAVEGWYWDSQLKVWQVKGVAITKQPAKANTPLRVQLRVMGQDEIETEVSAEAIRAALEVAGFDIASQSEPRANHNGNGARIYLEVLL